MSGDFIIHTDDYADAIKEMSVESSGRLFLALIAYASGEDFEECLDGDVLARSIFHIMRGHIDRDREYKERKSRAGKKGGAPIGNNNASKQAETSKNKQEQAEDKQKQTPNPKPNPKPKPIKNIYGANRNVFLTEEEIIKLKSQFPDYQKRIDDLSFYLASSGKTYKSHYMTILNWSRKEAGAVVKQNQFTQGVEQRDIDFDELEKKLVKN